MSSGCTYYVNLSEPVVILLSNLCVCVCVCVCETVQIIKSFP